MSTSDSPIPVFTLERLIDRHGPAIAARWSRLLAASSFVGGAEVEEFETAFAEAVGAAGCVGVANGTDALVLALRALELRPGDEVIVPSFTFIATAASVALVGGRPVFADVDAETLTLDAASVASRIGPRTVGVIGVHLFGRPFDAEALTDLCERRDLWLLEDAAQAHGASLHGRPAGSFGRLATWSFYPSKNLGCFGDGGAVTGHDPELLQRLRRLANHGRTAHYEHAEIGTNSRLDALQAAVLNERLPGLAEETSRRGEIACRYEGLLAGVGDLRLPREPEGAITAYHQYVLLSEHRDALKEFLASRGMGTAIHYPLPLHRQPAFADLDPAPCPEAERAAETILSLPLFPGLENAEVERVGAAVREFFAD